MTSEPHVYEAPNIREQALDTLLMRTEQRRDRRLIAAIELNQTRQEKNAKAYGKDAEKFEKAVNKAAKYLDQVRELLDKADTETRTAKAIHNNMTLLAQGLK